MCTHRGDLQVNYGQGKRAWNPSTRAPVFQKIEEARTNKGFAKDFALDLLLAKNDDYYSIDPFSNSTSNKMGFQKISRDRMKRENTLSQSASWVSQAFGAPAIKDAAGKWYEARALLTSKTKRFAQEKLITDANLIRQLDGGHYAFTATGDDGVEVYVPYSAGYMPKKGSDGALDAGNRKKGEAAQPKTTRTIVTAETATPKNILNSDDKRATLLGGFKRNTLLGGA